MFRGSVIALVVLAASASMASADTVYLLQDRNSSFQFEPDSGMVWQIDSRIITGDLGFAVRVGAAGPVVLLGNLYTEGGELYDTNRRRDVRADTLSIFYQNTPLSQAPQFDVELMFSLRGGAPGSAVADLASSALITNYADAPLDLYFYQFVNLDLGAADTVQRMNANTVRQWGSGAVAEMVTTPVPDGCELLDWSVLDKDLSTLPVTLGNTAGPLTGNASWVNQWHMVIAPGDTHIISQDLNTDVVAVPVPAGLWMGMGLLAGLRTLRARRAA